MPVQPSGPTIDPALRQQVSGAITSANQSLASARDRKASGSPDYQKAMAALMEANQRSATAKNNDDLQAALAGAEQLPAGLPAAIRIGPT